MTPRRLHRSSPAALALSALLATLALPGTACAQPRSRPAAEPPAATQADPTSTPAGRADSAPAGRADSTPAGRADSTPAGRADRDAARYADYARVLERHVDARGLVDYRSLAADPAALERALEHFAATDPDELAARSEDERLAFWLNAYNALTLKLIVDHYPIEPRLLTRFVFPKNSIRQIPGAWDEITWPVAGAERTLDEIEHAIIREDFDEPLVHAALVCAAMSCPPLRNEPYVGARLAEQLDDQLRRFVTDPAHVRVDADGTGGSGGAEVHLSAIFDWFGEDFVPSGSSLSPERAVLETIAPHLPAPQRRVVLSDDVEVEFLDYDWTLNDQTLGGRR